MTEVLHQTDPFRQKIGEWLDGIDAIREGVFNVFFIETEAGVIQVKEDNADRIEKELMLNFGQYYPDLQDVVEARTNDRD